MRGKAIKWAILGVGTAGRARAQAIAKDPRARLVAVHGGRFAEAVGVTVLPDLTATIDAAEAVAVCTPTAFHPDHVRAVLQAARHCLVEFPLAADAATAASLLGLASERGVILHVEHIELLDAPCVTLAAHVRPELVVEMEVHFERPGEDRVAAERLALGNVARLHRLTAIGGPVASVDAVSTGPARLEAELTLVSGATATCRFRQGPYFARRTWLSVQTADGGRWIQENGTLTRDGAPQTLLGIGGLFLRDQRAASARIDTGAPSYVSDARLLHVLDLVERLASEQTGRLPQR